MLPPIRAASLLAYQMSNSASGTKVLFRPKEKPGPPGKREPGSLIEPREPADWANAGDCLPITFSTQAQVSVWSTTFGRGFLLCDKKFMVLGLIPASRTLS